jgi:hypothetical protein
MSEVEFCKAIERLKVMILQLSQLISNFKLLACIFFFFNWNFLTSTARSAIPVYFDLIILVFLKTFIFSSTSADESTDHPFDSPEDEDSWTPHGT